jgi:hypothetical protein
LAGSIAEPGRGASFCFAGLLLAILGWRAGFERVNQASGNSGNIVDGREERGFICEGRLGEAANFPDELERSRANLFGSDWRIKIEKRSDVPAHFALHL